MNVQECMMQAIISRKAIIILRRANSPHCPIGKSSYRWHIQITEDHQTHWGPSIPSNYCLVLVSRHRNPWLQIDKDVGLGDNPASLSIAAGSRGP